MAEAVGGGEFSELGTDDGAEVGDVAVFDGEGDVGAAGAARRAMGRSYNERAGGHLGTRNYIMRSWLRLFIAGAILCLGGVIAFAVSVGSNHNLLELLLGGRGCTWILLCTSLIIFSLAWYWGSRTWLLAMFIVALCHLLFIAIFNTAMPPRSRYIRYFGPDVRGGLVFKYEDYAGTGSRELSYAPERSGVLGGSLGASGDRTEVDWGQWALSVSLSYPLVPLVIWIFRKVDRQFPMSDRAAFAVTPDGATDTFL